MLKFIIFAFMVLAIIGVLLSATDGQSEDDTATSATETTTTAETTETIVSEATTATEMTTTATPETTIAIETTTAETTVPETTITTTVETSAETTITQIQVTVPTTVQTSAEVTQAATTTAAVEYYPNSYCEYCGGIYHIPDKPGDAEGKDDEGYYYKFDGGVKYQWKHNHAFGWRWGEVMIPVVDDEGDYYFYRLYGEHWEEILSVLDTYKNYINPETGNGQLWGKIVTPDGEVISREEFEIRKQNIIDEINAKYE